MNYESNGFVFVKKCSFCKCMQSEDERDVFMSS